MLVPLRFFVWGPILCTTCCFWIVEVEAVQANVGERNAKFLDCGESSLPWTAFTAHINSYYTLLRELFLIVVI
jgi:hypothetical protein